MRRIYFDNSATTKVDEEVMRAMTPFLTDEYGNPSSLHSLGRKAALSMDESRKRAADAIGADEREIIFTSGGTESDNLAIKGVALSQGRRGGHIITSSIEHHAVINTCLHLEEMGFDVTYLPVDREGLVPVDGLRDAIREDTILITIIAANNEIGTIQPIADIGRIAGEKGIPFHTDAVQSITKVPIDVRKVPVDLLSISGHKFHGPKGIGALYLREGVKVAPLLHGGGHERGLRSSTENLPGVVGLSVALDLSIRDMERQVGRMERMRDAIISGVLREVEGSHLDGHPSLRLCNIAHFWFEGIDGKELVIELDSQGIAASTASACSSKDMQPSHVLRAIGLDPTQARGSLRLSLSRMNEMEEVDAFLEIFPGIIRNLRMR